MVNFKNNNKGGLTGKQKVRSRSNSDAQGKKSPKKKDEKAKDNDKVNQNQNDPCTTDTDMVTQINQTLNNQLNCIVCSKPVDDGSIECDICLCWVHNECSGMDKKDLTYALTNKKTILKFHCPKCLEAGNNQVSSHSSMIKDLTDKVDLVLAQHKEILNRLDARNNEEIKSTPVWPKVEQNIQSSFEEVFINQKEIEEKKYNIVLFGVPESGEPKDGKNNKKEDHDKAVDVVCHLDDQVSPDDLEPSDCKVTRLGRKRPEQDEKPRPIKVELPDVETRKRVLKNARLLKSYKIKKIGVSHDKTKKELEADRVLRADLRKTREENADVEYIIYDKKVMKKVEADKLREQKEKQYRERQEGKEKFTQRDNPNSVRGQVHA